MELIVNLKTLLIFRVENKTLRVKKEKIWEMLIFLSKQGFNHSSFQLILKDLIHLPDPYDFLLLLQHLQKLISHTPVLEELP